MEFRSGASRSGAGDENQMRGDSGASKSPRHRPRREASGVCPRRRVKNRSDTRGVPHAAGEQLLLPGQLPSKTLGASGGHSSSVGG